MGKDRQEEICFANLKSNIGGKYVTRKLRDFRTAVAREEGISEVYISTSHVGLYEKYGCELKTKLKDMNGELSRVYVKKIESFS